MISTDNLFMLPSSRKQIILALIMFERWSIPWPELLATWAICKDATEGRSPSAKCLNSGLYDYYGECTMGIVVGKMLTTSKRDADDT